MEEEYDRTKKETIFFYIFYSMMNIATLFLITATSMLFNPEQILNDQLRIVAIMSFFSFIFILASIMVTSMNGLIDTIYELIDRRDE